MTATQIIIDCDPGIDDAIALLAAFVSPEFDILAITAVSGNQPVEQTVRNALQICELGGRADIPVYTGSHRPLVREAIRGQFHGNTGLGNTCLPAPIAEPEENGAVEYLVDRLGEARRTGELVTLCCLGPMTNLAMALCIDPKIADGIKRIVMMGGAYREPGNRTMTTEYNMLTDPHAAHVVFSSGIPIVALPLDATHQVILTPDHVKKFEAASGRISASVADLMAFWDRNQVERYGSRGGPLHDPLVIAWLLAPRLFKTKRARIFIEHESELCMGQTVADWYGSSGLAPNAEIVTQVDAAGVIDLFLDRFSRYNPDIAA
ncbi:nucleoside hydrolase [Pelagibacterium sediminicola]|uniref:nucleoside hydrolase n=1 Tax=Pelagibacterium sediminicola TaxID=2248761 RepID=UPI000E3217EB|nr:nucleoside hydrolase [Pelagibacterium sediminicola]